MPNEEIKTEDYTIVVQDGVQKVKSNTSIILPGTQEEVIAQIDTDLAEAEMKINTATDNLTDAEEKLAEEIKAKNNLVAKRAKILEAPVEE